MITVVFYVRHDGLIKKMSVRGHSDYALSGTDIVCASASTLVYTAIQSLEELCGLKGFYTLKEEQKGSSGPEVSVTIPPAELDKGPDSPAQWIMASARIGFLLLKDTDRSDYGGNHIKVEQRPG